MTARLSRTALARDLDLEQRPSPRPDPELELPGALLEREGRRAVGRRLEVEAPDLGAVSRVPDHWRPVGIREGDRPRRDLEDADAISSPLRPDVPRRRHGPPLDPALVLGREDQVVADE